MYSGATTQLGDLGVEIPILRGVKQGDSLSPFLFNLVLGPLLEKLQATGNGFPVGVEEIAATAFADDVVRFAPSGEKNKEQLMTTVEDLASVIMKNSPEKCGCFLLERKGDAG